MDGARVPQTLLWLNTLFAGGVAYPWLADLAPALSGAVLVLLVLDRAVARSRSRAGVGERLLRPIAGGWRPRTALLATSLVVLVGGLEYATQLAMRLDWVAPYRAMETLVPVGTADYRSAHIVADRRREPDPLLWWRPRAAPPYTAQRMKGPLVATPKPPGVFRILCFGDSNTDGPAEGSWPELLHRRLAEREEGVAVEVLNAGVAGYSSHQGLLRFRELAGRFEPDLVVVSFGWNDATPVSHRADHEFDPPGPATVLATRVLIRFDFFRVLLQLARRPTEPGAGPRSTLRVPIDRYRGNLARFASEARAQGSEIVFLTRPYREPATPGHWPAEWMSGVPRYNQALIAFGAAEGASVIDVHTRLAAGHPERFADASHWNAAGREAMAQLLDKELSPRSVATRRP